MKLAILFSALFGSVSAPCVAADAPTRPTSLAGVVAQACPQFVEPILANPVFEIALRDRPIVVGDVCTCGVTRAFSDSLVAPLKDLSYPELNARLQKDTELQAYVLARSLQSIMQCYSEEIDVRLNESKRKRAGG